MTHSSCPEGVWVKAITVKCSEGKTHHIVCCSKCLGTTNGGTIANRFNFLSKEGKKPSWHSEFRALALTNESAHGVLAQLDKKPRVEPTSEQQQLA